MTINNDDTPARVTSVSDLLARYAAGERDFRWANLYGANLYDANLTGANLRGAKNPPTSHDFLAEVLRQAAGDDYAKRNVAGLVLISREWCWEQFGAIAQAHWTPELRAWIAATLAPWPELVTLARRYGVIERTAGEAESEGE